MNFILRLLVSTALVVLTSYITPGVDINSWTSALWVVIALAILNAIVRPILSLLSLPITILTLGLFSLVINAVIVLIAEHFVSGFTTTGFVAAFLFSIILSVLQSVAGLILKKD